MLLLNFTHPLTSAHVAQIGQVLTDSETVRVLNIPTQLDPQRGFAEQVRAVVDGVGLPPDAWQTEPMLVNLPGHNLQEIRDHARTARTARHPPASTHP